MAAEAELNALKKLESNKSCANCGAYNKFGHGNVCEKFKTFVCSNCKSAHQSFSQRVKSVTMSNWTKDEVDALKDEHGGGNAAAKRVWLGRWDESRLRKPKEGDHVDVYKRFIDKVYNDRAFYDEDAAANPSAGSSSSSSSAPVRKSGGSSRSVQSNCNGNGYSAPAPAANLLDFNSPTAASSSSSVPTFDAFASPPKGSGGDGWGAFSSAPAASNDGFGAFTSAPAPAPAPPQASFDPFGMSSSVPAPAPVAAPVASFDPFGPSTASSSVPVSTPNFDPFGGSSFIQQQPQQPAFGGFNAVPQQQQPRPMAPANFSAFDALAAPPQGMGMGMNMGMGGGMSRGPGMGMGMGMGVGMAPPQGMMMGGGMPRPMMNGGGYMGVGAPPQQQAAGYGGVRPGGMHGGSRDPFAGLGLPGK